MNDRNYIAIPGWMRTELDLKGNELLIYAIIYSYSQSEDQKYSGSRQYLADWCGASKQGIDKNLKTLIDKGLIVKEESTVKGVKFCSYVAQLPSSQLSCPDQLSGGQLSCPNNKDIYIYNTNTDNSNKSNTTNTDDNIILARFDKFWTVYPNKTGKGDARKAWKKIRPSEELTEKMIKAVQRQQHEDSRWLDGYIPNPSTWLNQERWEDKPFTQSKGKGKDPRKILSERDYDSKDFDEWTKVELKSW